MTANIEQDKMKVVGVAGSDLR